MTKFHKEYEHSWYMQFLYHPLKNKSLAFWFISLFYLTKQNVDMVFMHHLYYMNKDHTLKSRGSQLGVIPTIPFPKDTDSV